MLPDEPMAPVLDMPERPDMPEHAESIATMAAVKMIFDMVNFLFRAALKSGGCGCGTA